MAARPNMTLNYQQTPETMVHVKNTRVYCGAFVYMADDHSPKNEPDAVVLE